MGSPFLPGAFPPTGISTLAAPPSPVAAEKMVKDPEMVEQPGDVGRGSRFAPGSPCHQSNERRSLQILNLPNLSCTGLSL